MKDSNFSGTLIKRAGPYLLALLTVTLGCASRDKQAEVLLKGQPSKAITLEEITGNEVERPKKVRQKKVAPSKEKNSENIGIVAPRKVRGISSKAKQQCLNLVAKVVLPYRELFAKLNQATYEKDPNSTLEQMIQIEPDVCDTPDTSREAVALIYAGTNDHSGRLGIMLPLTGKNNQLTTYITKGMRAAFAESGQNFENATLLKDTSAPTTPERVLAELVFKDRVSAIVGGFENQDAAVLAKWSERLMLPVIITSHDRDVGQTSRYAYMLYPDEMRLAYTLAAEVQRRGIKRVAILKPLNNKSDRLVNYFKQALLAQGGQVSFDLIYTPGNFDSIQAVSRTMFKVDASERVDEYRAAYRKVRKQAQAQGVPFDPRMVVLKPIINFDAVFLPDDFRTARHFAKLFKFHQVDKLTMIGNHEWRSPALVEPYDTFFEGSFFADFIGNYASLPSAVSAPTLGSPFFVQPSNVLAVDFQLIGYRAGKVGAMLTTEKNTRRRKLIQKIDSMTSSSSSFFGTGLVFEKNRQSNWPTYVFGIANGGIQLEKELTNLNIPVATPKVIETSKVKLNTTRPPG
jgi:hypothetical protein